MKDKEGGRRNMLEEPSNHDVGLIPGMQKRKGGGLDRENLRFHCNCKKVLAELMGDFEPKSHTGGTLHLAGMASVLSHWGIA